MSRRAKAKCGREVYPGIWICRCHAFGEPHVRPLYVPASALNARLIGGEQVWIIAADYSRTWTASASGVAEAVESIYAALRWGLLSRDRRRRLLRRVSR